MSRNSVWVVMGRWSDFSQESAAWPVAWKPSEAEAEAFAGVLAEELKPFAELREALRKAEDALWCRKSRDPDVDEVTAALVRLNVYMKTMIDQEAVSHRDPRNTDYTVVEVGEDPRDLATKA